MEEENDILELASTPMSVEQLQELSQSIMLELKESRVQMVEDRLKMDRLRERMETAYEVVTATGLQMRETSRWMREQKEETDRWMREQKKETDKRIRDLTTRFTSQSGHIVEGLMEPSALHIFQKAGFDIDKCWKEMKGQNKSLGLKMEVDLFLHDTVESIAVEVKINCTKENIDHFMEQMGKFKTIFPEFSNSTVYGAIAAINYDRDTDRYASEKGLFVIRVSNDEIFTLDAADKNKMLTF